MVWFGTEGSATDRSEWLQAVGIRYIGFRNEQVGFPAPSSHLYCKAVVTSPACGASTRTFCAIHPVSLMLTSPLKVA